METTFSNRRPVYNMRIIGKYVNNFVLYRKLL
jgi:hypothetical protein